MVGIWSARCTTPLQTLRYFENLSRTQNIPPQLAPPLGHCRIKIPQHKTLQNLCPQLKVGTEHTQVMMADMGNRSLMDMLVPNPVE